jgi:hypothetical protein
VGVERCEEVVMVSLRAVVRRAAIALGAIGVATVPAVVSAQEGNLGALVIEVVVTGDTGGDPTAVAFIVTRQSAGETVLSGTGQIAPQTFSLPSGSYLLVPSVTNAAYVITDTSCRSQAGQGPNRPDFIIDGAGQGGGGDARCVITVRYTAPPPSTTTTTTTTAPGETTTTAPGATTTTVGPSALPPGGVADGGSTGSATVTGTIPLTGATDETTTIVAAALALLLLGAGAVTVARRH